MSARRAALEPRARKLTSKPPAPAKHSVLADEYDVGKRRLFKRFGGQ